MPLQPGPTRNAIGFLTVIEHAQHGLFGGYLVLNATGRPLEFHCTAPVKPSRAQEILYGPTLQPYLYGEQIGQSLLEKAGIEPWVVFTDVAGALEVGHFVDPPVVLVDTQPDKSHAESMASANEVASSPVRRLDKAHPAGPTLSWFRVGRNRLGLATDRIDDRRKIERQLQTAASQLDLAEPFGRIHDAIEEAQRGSRG